MKDVKWGSGMIRCDLKYYLGAVKRGQNGENKPKYVENCPQD